MKIKNLLFSVILLSFIIHHSSVVYASYVLPYPSYMPGNKLYKITRIVDQLKKYWYFGNIAQIKYHLGLSDKYLVESKTLFEYKQYLLAVDALKRSSSQFSQIQTYVVNADKEGIDMKVFKETIASASVVHQNILEQLIQITPQEYEWKPEKMNSEQLQLHNDLQNAINVVRDTVQ
jgi:hypothetical protein